MFFFFCLRTGKQNTTEGYLFFLFLFHFVPSGVSGYSANTPLWSSACVLFRSAFWKGLVMQCQTRKGLCRKDRSSTHRCSRQNTRVSHLEPDIKSCRPTLEPPQTNLQSFTFGSSTVLLIGPGVAPPAEWPPQNLYHCALIAGAHPFLKGWSKRKKKKKKRELPCKHVNKKPRTFF